MRKPQLVPLIALLVVAIGGAALAADSAAQTPAPVGVVNINTADVSQLANLPRVGPKVAQRVVDYRTAHGPFKKTSDLMQVKGFGEKRFASLSAYLTIEGKTTLTSKVSGPRKPRKSRTPATPASK